MKYNIAVIPGDGIGPEIVGEAQRVLDAVGKKFGHEFNYTKVLMGGCSIDVHGVPLTEEALQTVRTATPYCSAQSAVMWVCPTGTIVRRRSVPKLVFWHCVRDWNYLRISVRRIFTRN